MEVRHFLPEIVRTFVKISVKVSTMDSFAKFRPELCSMLWRETRSLETSIERTSRESRGNRRGWLHRGNGAKSDGLGRIYLKCLISTRRSQLSMAIARNVQLFVSSIDQEMYVAAYELEQVWLIVEHFHCCTLTSTIVKVSRVFHPRNPSWVQFASKFHWDRAIAVSMIISVKFVTNAKDI